MNPRAKFMGALTPYNGESNGLISPSPSPANPPSWNPLPPSPHIGVCYGTNGSNLPLPREVIALYEQNNIQKIRLYSPDQDVLQALRGSNIEVMLGVPNADIEKIAASQNLADAWVKNNVKNYGDVKFRYIAVGRGLQLDDLSKISLIPAMQNIHDAVSATGLKIKVSSSIDTKVLGNSFPPSVGNFTEDFRKLLNPVIGFLNKISSPLLVELYPYFIYAGNTADISLDFALFTASFRPVLDGPLQYSNLFDSIVDAFFAAIEESGGDSLEIVVSETGWPSAGGLGATIENAQTYNFNLIKHVKGGTPRKPEKTIETYIFSMFDENNRDSEVQKHWGLFLPNKQPKYVSIGTPLFEPGSAAADPPLFGFAPHGPPNSFPPKRRKNRTGLLVRITIAACALIFGLGFTLLLFWWKRKENERDVLTFDVSFGGEFGNVTGPREFSFDELSKARKNFADEEKLGEGGFGAVYKGFLRDSKTNVAVKRVSRRSTQGIKEYASEVRIISRLRHKNLVKLIGWCHEKELLLAYEFMPGGSLDSHLFKGRSLLPWEVRYKIVQGIASALFYLHEEGDFCVLHRDIKASNIMLDSAFNAKLGDFGLARMVDPEKGSRTTLLAGTMDYIAPECHRTGKASKESDIYSFGVVALEIACGRRSIEPRYDEHEASLVTWVWEAYENQMLLDVADKKLSTEFNVKEMECLMLVGLWCAHPSRSMRPSIRQAIQVLNFEAPLPNLPSKMPIPNYDIPTSSGIKTSEPDLLSITVPR